MKSRVQSQAEQQRRAFVRKLIAAEILSRRGEGPLALRPPRFVRTLEDAPGLGGQEPRR